MKQFIILAIIFSGICFSINGQADAEIMKNQKLEAMNKLSFMIGTWEGTGWYQMGQDERDVFDIHETITEKLDGLLLLIEGHGTSNGQTVHKALAVISWDPDNEQYNFESHTYDGRSANATASLKGNVFTWGFDVPGRGSIQYVINISEDDEWIEKGSYSPDGEAWYPFMGMSLKRIKE